METRQEWCSIIGRAKAKVIRLGIRHKSAAYARWLRTAPPEIRHRLQLPSSYSSQDRSSSGHATQSSMECIEILSPTSTPVSDDFGIGTASRDTDRGVELLHETSSSQDSDSPQIIFVSARKRPVPVGFCHYCPGNKRIRPTTDEAGSQTDDSSFQSQPSLTLPILPLPPRRPDCPCLCFCGEHELDSDGPTSANRFCASVFPNLSPSKMAHLNSLLAAADLNM